MPDQILTKMIIVGDSEVGKTSLAYQYTNKVFSEEYIQTIGTNFLVKDTVFQNYNITLQIWDTAGQERFQRLLPNYYKGSQIAFVVYSITDKKSFDNVGTWFKLAKKYGESQKIVNAIAAHHDEVKAGSIEAVLVQAGDALSAARPGARREMLETYIKRLEDLERIANGFKGVEKSYAIQAGREVRILVESQEINDDQAVVVARQIAQDIEKELAYPGQIKVTVIRETRAVDYAK